MSSLITQLLRSMNSKDAAQNKHLERDSNEFGAVSEGKSDLNRASCSSGHIDRILVYSDMNKLSSFFSRQTFSIHVALCVLAPYKPD